MKKGFYLLGSIGLGAGLMYVFDPTSGRRRRHRGRNRLRALRYQMGHALDEAIQTARDWTHRAAVPSSSWPVHMPDIHRTLATVQRRHSRQRRMHRTLLLVSGLGLGTVLMSLNGAGIAWQRAMPNGAAKTLHEAYSWTCGMLTGVGGWFLAEKDARATPAPRTAKK